MAKARYRCLWIDEDGNERLSVHEPRVPSPWGGTYTPEYTRVMIIDVDEILEEDPEDF